jgi:hypothetical protein
MKKTLLLSIAVCLFISSSAFANLNDGLVAHWAFDEGSGNIAYDTVGGNNGTLQNGPTWTAGVINGAIDLDGINDYITCGDILDADLQNAFTIGVWIKLDEGALQRTDPHTILWKSDDRPGLAVRPDSRVAFRHWHSQETTAHAFQSAQLLEERQWNHIAYIFDGSDFTGYVNADYAGGVQDSVYSPGGSVYIGADLGARCFTGLMDDLRIYNRALSPEEIGQLYAVPEPATLSLLALGGLALLRRRK